MMIQRALVVVGIAGAMIAVHILDLLLGGFLKGFGIRPRDVDSAYTIVTAPWLHGDFGHLANNLTGFVVLASLCLIDGIRRFITASAVIIVVGGAMLWLFGRDAIHIGASGWIFGLWSLVIAQAWFDRRWRTIAIAVGVVVFYGSMAWGVLPTQGDISFEGHFFGAVAGLLAAWMLAGRPVARRPAKPHGELKFWS